MMFLCFRAGFPCSDLFAVTGGTVDAKQLENRGATPEIVVVGASPY